MKSIWYDMDISNVREFDVSSKGYFSSLKGSYYEIGKQQGEFVKQNPYLIPQFIHEENVISNNHWTESRNILNKHCPGINEEIEGFVKC